MSWSVPVASGSAGLRIANAVDEILQALISSSPPRASAWRRPCGMSSLCHGAHGLGAGSAQVVEPPTVPPFGFGVLVFPYFSLLGWVWVLCPASHPCKEICFP